MFPSLAARETCAAEINVAPQKQKNVFALSQKHSGPWRGHKFCVATRVAQLQCWLGSSAAH